VKIIAAFALGLALASTLSTAPAQAQATRTFVSPTGSDASATCSLAAPCRTFLAAYALTNAGGEIAVLGTAGYGTLTISKAISIVNGGGFEAGIAVPSGGTGITINAGPNDAVSLRGLTIEGAGLGSVGIQFNTGKSLTIQNSVAQHFTSTGISFFPNQSTSSQLIVKDTFVANNGNDGILVFPFIGAGAVTAVFNHVETDNNGIGISLETGTGGTVTAIASDCVSTGNSTDGFIATSGAGGVSVNLMLVGSVAANNGTGIEAFGIGAVIRVGLTTVTGNGNGWMNTVGVLQSYGDNKINGNTAHETSPPLVTGGGK
jgi:hypothetical protein